MHYHFCCVTPMASNTSETLPLNPSVRVSSAPDRNNGNVNNNNHNNQNHQGSVKIINEVVGNGISGILYKWVNYGRGWRPRWFVLQDAVLSYYKIHGPDKIALSQEAEKGSRLIGEGSMRRVSKRHFNPPCRRTASMGGASSSSTSRRPVGEVHLKVSSIRESRSDDKRFSIFTGTKTLHLRAESREDRSAWMEALQAVKEMFPRISNSELMAPVDDAVISTERLRQRLVEAGLSEPVIEESEEIMRTEFSSMQTQLVLLRQKHLLLLDTLRQLEVHVKISRKAIKSPIQNSSAVSSSCPLSCF